MSGEAEGSVDFDLHGLVGIRLIGAAPADRGAVEAQLGPITGELRREPDMVIRFVDRIAGGERMRLIGVGDAGFTDEDFFLLRGKGGVPIRVRVPFDRIGLGCELVCERGLPAVPLLIGIINLTALARGGLAMHASAFRHEGTDVLVTGWSKGGKTELLLGFAARGARYIGDEWIYASGDGKRILGIPEPIRVWDWHLQQLESYRSALSPRRRGRLRALRYASAALGAAGALGGRSGGLTRVADLVARQRHAHLEPRAAFGPGFGPLEGTARKVVFVASHTSPNTTVDPIDPEEIADRMAFSLREEREVLMAGYRRFRFAFPHRPNPLLESAAELEHRRLRAFLDGLECHAVHHPYPPSIPELVDAVAAVLRPNADPTVPSDLVRT